MLALLDYLYDLRFDNECHRHGKKYMVKYPVGSTYAKVLFMQDDLYYCVACLQEIDTEERTLQKADVLVMSPGIK